MNVRLDLALCKTHSQLPSTSRYRSSLGGPRYQCEVFPGSKRRFDQSPLLVCRTIGISYVSALSFFSECEGSPWIPRRSVNAPAFPSPAVSRRLFTAADTPERPDLPSLISQPRYQQPLRSFRDSHSGNPSFRAKHPTGSRPLHRYSLRRAPLAQRNLSQSAMTLARTR